MSHPHTDTQHSKGIAIIRHNSYHRNFEDARTHTFSVNGRNGMKKATNQQRKRITKWDGRKNFSWKFSRHFRFSLCIKHCISAYFFITYACMCIWPNFLFRLMEPFDLEHSKIFIIFNFANSIWKLGGKSPKWCENINERTHARTHAILMYQYIYYIDTFSVNGTQMCSTTWYNMTMAVSWKVGIQYKGRCFSSSQ